MNVTYTGKQEHLHPKQKDQLDSKLAKIAKLLDVSGKGEKQARIVLNHEKNLHRAEVTLNYLDHAIVGEHMDADQFTALNLAIEKLERQMLKVRDKRRDPKKGPREVWDKGVSADTINAAPAPDALTPVNGRPRVFRVQPADDKPLTVEEAILAIENDPYIVYQDARTDRPAVLLRRNDGNFDLVEC